MTQKEKWQIGNVIFGLCGGWLFAAIWFLIGAFFYVLYIGRPVARYCFLIARFAARPYGRVVGTTGDYNFFGNMIWMVFMGMPWAFVCIFAAGICMITLVGVPIGIQYLRLAGLVVAPVGMQFERQLEDWEWQKK